MSSFYKAFEDRFRGSRELISGRLTVYLPLVEPLKAIYPDSLAIDLGCGRGEWLELLQRNGFKSHGVDTDEGMLENAAAFGLSTELRDALDYLRSLPDESVCIVSGFHIAEHLPFEVLQDLVQESLRVLKPAGILILETPNPENISVGSNSFYLDPTHVRPLPPLLLSFLPEYYGFSRVNVFRLNSSISEINNISLLNVINGASPDYSVIAQKNAAEEVLALFNDEFYKKHGFAVDELATHYEKTSHGRKELENLLNTQVQREQAAAEKVEAVRLQVAHESAELARSLDETHNTLNIKQAEQQQAFNQQLEAEKHERIAREQALLEQAHQTRQEVENLRHTQTQNEQSITDQMDAARNDADQQSAALTRLLTEQQAVLHNQHTEREETLTQQLEAEKQERKTREQTLLEQTNQTRQQLEDLLRNQAQRERAVAEQVDALHSQAKQEATELAKTLIETQTLLHNQHAEREGTLTQRFELEKQERVAREQALLEHANQTRQELENYLSNQVKREQVVKENMEAALKLAAVQNSGKERELVNKHTEREQAFSRELKAAQENLKQLQQDKAKREKEFSIQVDRGRQELKDIFCKQAEREKEIATQLLNLQQQAAKEMAEVSSNVLEQERELARKQAEREEVHNQQRLKDCAELKRDLVDQSSKSKQGLKDILDAQVIRENNVAAQLLTFQQQAAHEKKEFLHIQKDQGDFLHRQYAEKEQALRHQLHATRDHLHAVEKCRLQHEVEYTAQINKTRKKLETNLQQQMLREQDIGLQLQVIRQQAAEEAADLTRNYVEYERELHRQQHEREHTFTLQLQAAQEERLKLEREQTLQEQSHSNQLLNIRQQAELDQAEQAQQYKQVEKTLQRQHAEKERVLSELHEATQNREITALQGEAQAKQQAQQLKLQQAELDKKLKLQHSMLEDCEALEAQLKQEIACEHQNSLVLRHSLSKVEQSLKITRASLTWRLSTPLRKLASLFIEKEPVDISPSQIHDGNTTKLYSNINLEKSVEDNTGKDFTEFLTLAKIISENIVENDQSHDKISRKQSTVPLITEIQATEFRNTSSNHTMPISTPVVNQPTAIKATTLEELLAHYDIQFIYCAYLTLLGREPDADGLNYYSRRLRSGFSKISVLLQLKQSFEGKSHAADVTGLNSAINKYKKEQQPLIGWVFRLVNDGENNHPTERKLRILENQLHIFSNESDRRFNKMDSTLAGLHQLVIHQTQSLVTALAGIPTNHLAATTSSAVKSSAPEGFEVLPPRARDIYFQLKTEAAMHAQRIT